MTESERIMGVSKEHYNALVVLFHAWQCTEIVEQYRQDAQRTGDAELVAFFDEVQQQNRRRAERAKVLLRHRLGAHSDTQGKQARRTASRSWPRAIERGV